MSLLAALSLACPPLVALQSPTVDLPIQWSTVLEASIPTEDSVAASTTHGGLAYMLLEVDSALGAPALLQAFDIEQGQELWVAELSAPAGSEPAPDTEGHFLSRLSDGRLVAVTERRFEIAPTIFETFIDVHCVAEQGQLLWSTSLLLEDPLAVVCEAAGTLVVSARPSAGDETELVGLQLSDGSELFRKSEYNGIVDMDAAPNGLSLAALRRDLDQDLPFSPPLLDLTLAQRIDAQTGELIWSRPLWNQLTAPLGQFQSYEHIAFTSDAEQVIVGGVGDQAILVALGGDAGNDLWSIQQQFRRVKELTTDLDGQLHVFTSNGNGTFGLTWLRVDPDTGQLFFDQTLDTFVSGFLEPTVDPLAQRIYLGGDRSAWSMPDAVYSLDAQTSTLAWTTEVDPNSSAPSLRGLTWSASSNSAIGSGDRPAPELELDGALWSFPASGADAQELATFGSFADGDHWTEFVLFDEGSDSLFVVGQWNEISQNSSSVPFPTRAWVGRQGTDGSGWDWVTALPKQDAFNGSPYVDGMALFPSLDRLWVAAPLEEQGSQLLPLDMSSGDLGNPVLLDPFASLEDWVLDFQGSPAEDTMYAMTSGPDVDSPLKLLALEPLTGATRWEVDLGDGLPQGDLRFFAMHVQADGSSVQLVTHVKPDDLSETPLVVSSYASSDGSLQWSTQLDWSLVPGPTSLVGQVRLSSVPGSSDLVLAANGRAPNLLVTAFVSRLDAISGQTLWTLNDTFSSGPVAGATSTSIDQLAVAEGRNVFFETRDIVLPPSNSLRPYLHARSLSDGTLLWSKPLEADPLGGDLFPTLLPDESTVAISMRLFNLVDGTRTATIGYHAPTGEELWRVESTADEGLSLNKLALIPHPDGRRLFNLRQVPGDPDFRNLETLALQVPRLVASPAELSLSGGGQQFLSMNGGSASAGRIGFLLGSLSGSAPGTPIAGGLNVPLNVDGYTLQTLFTPGSSPLFGNLTILNESGHAEAQLTLPAGSLPELAGVTAHHAWIEIDLQSGALLTTSEAARVELLP